MFAAFLTLKMDFAIVYSVVYLFWTQMAMEMRPQTNDNFKAMKGRVRQQMSNTMDNIWKPESLKHVYYLLRISHRYWSAMFPMCLIELGKVFFLEDFSNTVPIRLVKIVLLHQFYPLNLSPHSALLLIGGETVQSSRRE